MPGHCPQQNLFCRTAAAHLGVAAACTSCCSCRAWRAVCCTTLAAGGVLRLLVGVPWGYWSDRLCIQRW